MKTIFVKLGRNANLIFYLRFFSCCRPHVIQLVWLSHFHTHFFRPEKSSSPTSKRSLLLSLLLSLRCQTSKRRIKKKLEMVVGIFEKGGFLILFLFLKFVLSMKRSAKEVEIFFWFVPNDAFPLTIIFFPCSVHTTLLILLHFFFVSSFTCACENREVETVKGE